MSGCPARAWVHDGRHREASLPTSNLDVLTVVRQRWAKVIRTNPKLVGQVVSVLRAAGIDARVGSNLHREDERLRFWVRTDDQSVFVPNASAGDATRVVRSWLARRDEGMRPQLQAVRNGVGLVVFCASVAVLPGAIAKGARLSLWVCAAASVLSAPFAWLHVRAWLARKRRREARERRGWPTGRSR